MIERDLSDAAGPAMAVASTEHDGQQPVAGAGEPVAASDVPADTEVASGTAADEPGRNVTERMPAGDEQHLAQSRRVAA